MAKSSSPEGTLAALDEALQALDKANAADTPDRMRVHMGKAVIAINEALRYAEATAFEVEENKRPLN